MSTLTRLTRRIDDQRGMTLVELLVVLSVVGILFAIAAPTISNHIALQHMRGSTQQIVDILREARSSAVDEGQPRYVLFSPPRSVQAFRYDGTEWLAESQPEVLPTTVSFTDAEVTFPALTDEPEAGAPSVPENAAYFDTRGAYPFDIDLPVSYSMTLRGGVGRVETLTLFTATGQVTNP